jgi:hypothetical protein
MDGPNTSAASLLGHRSSSQPAAEGCADGHEEEAFPRSTGEVVTDWFPMGKGVANMPRYREISMAANRRYLEALAVVPDSGHL